MMALFAHFVHHCHPYIFQISVKILLFVPFLLIKCTFAICLLLDRQLAYGFYVHSVACNKMVSNEEPVLLNTERHCGARVTVTSKIQHFDWSNAMLVMLE